ncbi:MAG: hypothetical protein ACREOU_13480 [Candidatus Eiseniibacteriota bacterium]
MASNPRAIVRFALLSGALAVAGPVAPAEAATKARTDAFTVEAPPNPWKRAPGLEIPGLLSWTYEDSKGASALLRLSFEAVPVGTHPDSAMRDLLSVQRRGIAGQVDNREGMERGAFQPDSLRAGGLTWWGFRVHVKTDQQAGDSYRYFALHPEFPARRRAFLLSYDEYVPKNGSRPGRITDARKVAASLVPQGKGLAGNLEEAWLDGRVATIAARIDSAQRLCWSMRADAAPSSRFLGVGVDLALEGDFYELSDVIPRDSLVDAAALDYGSAFDRNDDGRYDLTFSSRGMQTTETGSLVVIVVAIADDDFDGKVDGCVVETGDADGNNRVDHRLLVRDTNRDGVPDRAIRFTDAISGPDAAPVKIDKGLVVDRLTESKADRMEFQHEWREATLLLAGLSAAGADCRPKRP